MGHKGPVLRPKCIGPGRAQTQNTILFYSTHLIVKRKDWGRVGVDWINVAQDRDKWRALVMKLWVA